MIHRNDHVEKWWSGVYCELNALFSFIINLISVLRVVKYSHSATKLPVVKFNKDKHLSHNTSVLLPILHACTWWFLFFDWSFEFFFDRFFDVVFIYFIFFHRFHFFSSVLFCWLILFQNWHNFMYICKNQFDMRKKWSSWNIFGFN